MSSFLEQESKSNPNHIQADSTNNGGSRLSSPIHRNRLNGMIRINITPNPLDEKVSQVHNNKQKKSAQLLSANFSFKKKKMSN